MRQSAFAIVMLAALCATAHAQPRQEGPQVPVVVTAGEGAVHKAPDRAWVTIGAESRAATAQEAQRANADAMSAVNAKLKAAGIPPDAIQTIGYDLQPEFDYANGRQRLRGYVARNQVQIKVDALEKLGDIIGAAVATGATNVSGIRFDLRDRQAAEREALRLAVADARQRADAAAAGAGMRVESVLRIEEQRDIPVQPRPMMMARAEAAPSTVPIEAGEIEIRARVTLTAGVR
jgi:uncharacterized protein YggE